MYVCNITRGANDSCSAPERCWTIWHTFAIKCLQTELNVIGCFRKWELSVSWDFVWFEWTASTDHSPRGVLRWKRAWGMIVKPWQLGGRGSLRAIATRVVWLGWDNSVGIATCYLTLRLPNWIPYVIRVILIAGKVFTHNCATWKLSALIQCWYIMHQIERDGFQRCQT
jgi:hypothetical protein